MDEKLTPQTLDQLKNGQTAVVSALTCGGSDRRRLMDLGILPGTRIEIEMKSPLGDPIAYRVRGTVIALRHKQARDIQIKLETQETEPS